MSVATDLIAINNIGFGELISKCKTWNKKEPILKNHELVAINDLTHVDLVIRQINYSEIINRLLEKCIDGRVSSDSEFNFKSG